MIGLLPPWALTNPQPAFLESESGSVLNQTAKMYAKVNELVESYNSFTQNINKEMEEFLKADAKAKEEHMTAIRQEFQDFINVIDLKVMELEKQIRDAESYMKTNIVSTTKTEVDKALRNRTIAVDLDYNSGTEELKMVLTEGSE